MLLAMDVGEITLLTTVKAVEIIMQVIEDPTTGSGLPILATVQEPPTMPAGVTAHLATTLVIIVQEVDPIDVPVVAQESTGTSQDHPVLATVGTTTAGHRLVLDVTILV